MIYSSVFLYSVIKMELDTGILLLPIFFFLLLKLAVTYVQYCVLYTTRLVMCFPVVSDSLGQTNGDFWIINLAGGGCGKVLHKT